MPIARLAFGTSLALLLASTMMTAGQAASDPTPARVQALVERVNARLAAGGMDLRLTEAWFFTVGRGVDPFRQLRTGSRWPFDNLFYMIDGSDLTGDVPVGADVALAIRNGYDSWNAVGNTTVHAIEIADIGLNVDILDGIVLDGDGECVDIIDTTAANLVSYDPVTGAVTFIPVADVLVGGWLPPAYFADCLGNPSILAVTFSFSFGDSNADNYPDLLYVEQYYNDGFDWTIEGSQYLDFDGPSDIETVAVHENGHAFGLGHFGGPNEQQPFKLQPNLRVFDPEAVMNPFNLGGEKRELFPTDVSALRALYARRGTQ